jgi:predicted membrane-bound spermidine synthase
MKKNASAKSPDKTKKPQKQHPDHIYLLVAFLEGAAVIAVELLGAKMLSPYYGTSLAVWTAVIGITIGFLTIGYFVGGLFASKNNLLRILSYALALASLFVVIMPAWAKQLFLIANNMSIHAGATFVAMMLLGPPLLCLGSTSPLIIQQLTKQVQLAGKNAGKVYAVSTIGGVIFNFFLGFAIIPEFGISKPLMILSIALLALSIFLYFEKKHIIIIVPVGIFFIISISGNIIGNKTGFFPVMYESEGLLGQLKVMEHQYPEYDHPNRYLLINGLGNTDMINISEEHRGYSGFTYVHTVAMIASLKHGHANALLLGLGGGSIAKELQQLGMKVDAVDIDNRMLGVAKEFFYLNDSTVNFFIDDARHYVRTTKKKYDIVVFDVLNNDTQPSYVFTNESFTELKNILADNGIAIIEFQEDKEKEGYYVYQSICNTFLALGYKTYVHPGDDLIVVASLNEIDISKYSIENFTPCCRDMSWAAEFIKQPFTKCVKPYERGVVLCDDKPMIDVMNAQTVLNWRIRALNSFGKNMLSKNQRIFE